MFRIIILFVCIQFVISNPKRILAIFPTPCISHQVVFRPFVLELARRGHEVTVITTDPAFKDGQSPKNLKEIDVHDISYGIWSNFTSVERGTAGDHVESIQLACVLLVDIFEAQAQSPQVQNLINNKNEKFDLLITETCARPSLSFSYIYDVPVIDFSSLGGTINTYVDLGGIEHPLLYPVPLQQKIRYKNLWEKIHQTYIYYALKYMYSNLEIIENKMLKRVFGPKIPELSELKKNIHLRFLNVNPIWDVNRPIPPNFIYIGGLHNKKEKELPKDLKNVLDSSKYGVIYISFGTNVKPSLLPPDKINIFVKVFSELPYDVLWKWDQEEFPGCPKNVILSKWYPQSDLLKHPKINLFITQGGLQSTDEAIAAAVPVIGVPLLADQYFNADNFEVHNIGIRLNMETLTEDQLRNAINATIQDPKYRSNMRKLRRILNDQPQTPLERAVWWTEYVLRNNGAGHLRTVAAGLHWTEYYELELIFVMLAVILIIFIVIIGLLLKFAYMKIFCMHNKLKIN